MEKHNIFLVYKMKIALRLIDKGHIVSYTMPNPNNNKFIVWAFQIDETLMTDFEEAVAADKEVYNGR